jgi:dienelactone hydrolase
MKGIACLLVSIVLALGARAGAQEAPGASGEGASPPPPGAPAAEEVTYPSDGLELKGLMYRPAAGRPEGAGPFPAILWNHGSERNPGPCTALARFYTEKGFVLFLPRRRGHGGNPGEYIGDGVAAAPREARNERMVELQEAANRDVAAAVAFLKKLPYVDPTRIVVSGCSYGGIQTVLAAEKELGIRAAVPFAPAAMSWKGNPAIRARLEAAVRNRKVPMFILQAENDYDLAPSEALARVLPAVSLAGKSKVYAAFGDPQKHQDGHGGFAVRGGAVWGADVLAFLADAFAAPPAAAGDGRPAGGSAEGAPGAPPVGR